MHEYRCVVESVWLVLYFNTKEVYSNMTLSLQKWLMESSGFEKREIHLKTIRGDFVVTQDNRHPQQELLKQD